MVTVLIAGGGTGGHVYPMVAVGEALVCERGDTEVVYVGTGRGIEARVVPELGGRLERLDVLPLRGRGWRGVVRGALRAATVFPEARSLVRRLKPQVVFSVGGYAAGPVALAARSCGVPVTLLEPNAVLGFTNKMLKRLVQRAYVCFPEVRDGFAPGTALWTGVPLRSRFEASPYEPAGPVRLLVMGGSQGAQALNEAVPDAVAACVRSGLGLTVVHQAGRGKESRVWAAYDRYELADRVRVVPFIDDVAQSLQQADVVVERAGAGSLAELCAVGRAAIIVPYPYAADDHQLHNAQSLQRAGAAVCVTQAEALAERLSLEIQRLAGDAQLRSHMAERAAQRGRPDAARVIARDLLEIASGRNYPERREAAGRHTPTAAGDGEDCACSVRAARSAVEVCA